MIDTDFGFLGLGVLDVEVGISNRLSRGLDEELLLASHRVTLSYG
jgi:hypothetical protein